MWAAILILCAVAAEAAPLAAKSVHSAAAAAPTPAAPAAAFDTAFAGKVSKFKKFLSSNRKTFFPVMKPTGVLAKPGGTITTLRTETSVADFGTTPSAAPLAGETVVTTRVITAPLVKTAGNLSVTEEDLELLKSHIEMPFVGSIFQDEKVRRFDHSTLFGYATSF